MESNRNPVGWFEVPVTDMPRAMKFYETVFGFQLSHNVMGPLEMAWFPGGPDAAGSAGSLVKHPEYYKPSTEGVLVYFSSRTGNLDDELARVAAAGGTVVQPKTLITEEYGYMALILDSEGNRVALHSVK